MCTKNVLFLFLLLFGVFFHNESHEIINMKVEHFLHAAVTLKAAMNYVHRIVVAHFSSFLLKFLSNDTKP